MRLSVPAGILVSFSLCSTFPAYGQTTVTGTVQATFWIATNTPIPTGGVIDCNLTAAVTDTNASYNESATAIGTVSNSTSAYCVVAIPYQWTLATPGSDSISFSYTVEFTANGSPGATILRQTSSTLPNVTVPASGTTVPLGPTTVSL